MNIKTCKEINKTGAANIMLLSEKCSKKIIALKISTKTPYYLMWI